MRKSKLKRCYDYAVRFLAFNAYTATMLLICVLIACLLAKLESIFGVKFQ